MRGNKLFQATNLYPNKSLCIDIIGGQVLNTSAIVPCLLVGYVIRQGYCSRRVIYPNHLSYQNLTCDSSYNEGPKMEKLTFNLHEARPKI